MKGEVGMAVPKVLTMTDKILMVAWINVFVHFHGIMISCQCVKMLSNHEHLYCLLSKRTSVLFAVILVNRVISPELTRQHLTLTEELWIRESLTTIQQLRQTIPYTEDPGNSPRWARAVEMWWKAPECRLSILPTIAHCIFCAYQGWPGVHSNFTQ